MRTKIKWTFGTQIKKRKITAIGKNQNRCVKLVLEYDGDPRSFSFTLGSKDKAIRKEAIRSCHEEMKNNLYRFLSGEGFNHSEITIK